MPGQKTKVIVTRVTLRLAELIEKYCRQDAHINPADFIRDAIMEKIQRDAPKSLCPTVPGDVMLLSKKPKIREDGTLAGGIGQNKPAAPSVCRECPKNSDLTCRDVKRSKDGK